MTVRQTGKGSSSTFGVLSCKVSSPRSVAYVFSCSVCSYGADYFTKLLEDNLTSRTKPQFVEDLGKVLKSKTRRIGTILEQSAEKDNLEEVIDAMGWFPSMNFKAVADTLMLELRALLDRDIDQLSGGEAQRFALATVAVSKRDMYVAIRNTNTFSS